MVRHKQTVSKVKGGSIKGNVEFQMELFAVAN